MELSSLLLAAKVHSILQMVLHRGCLMIVMVIFRKVMINMSSTVIVTTNMTIWTLMMEGVEIMVVVHLFALVPAMVSLVEQMLTNNFCAPLMSNS